MSGFKIKNIWFVGRKERRRKKRKGNRREGTRDGKERLLKGRRGGRERMNFKTTCRLHTFIRFCKYIYIFIIIYIYI